MKSRFTFRNSSLTQRLQPARLPLAVLLVCFGYCATPAHAGVLTWTGTTDGSWDVPANWGGTAFANDDDVVFTGAMNPSTVIARPRTVSSISFPSTTAASFSVSLSASNGATKTLTFNSGNTGIKIAAGDTFAHQIVGPGGGSGSYIQLNGPVTIAQDGTQDFTITRPFAGNFGITKTGTGRLIYSGPQIYAGQTGYTGDTTITGGAFQLGASDVIPDGAGKGNVVVDSPAILELNGKTDTINGLSGSGTVSSASGGALSIGGNDTTSTFAGVIQDADSFLSVTKVGSGTLTLSGVNAYSGPTTIQTGKLVGVTGGSAAASQVVMNTASATLGVSVTDNTLSWTAASFSANEAGTLEFNFGNVAPSASVAPLKITGLADFLTTPTVKIVGSNFTPGSYPLISWDSTFGTAPTEVALPGGVSGSVGLSGDGKSLVLTIDTVDSTTKKADNTNALNVGTSWVGGVVPGPAGTAEWDSTVTGANSTVLGEPTTWKGLKITNPGGMVTIGGGSALTLGDATVDIDLAAASADLALQLPLVAGGPNVWSVAAGRLVTISGQVSGAGAITKQGPGTVSLEGPNSFTGGLTLSAGKLAFDSDQALGNPASTFTIESGVIDTAGFGSVFLGPNPMAWNGDFTFAGSNDLDLGTGAVALSADRSVNVAAMNLTVGGAISGSASLTKKGIGALTLAGDNTFNGGVFLNTGRLNVNSGGALGTGILTIQAGVTLGNTSGVAVTATANNQQDWLGNFTYSGNAALDLGIGSVALSGNRVVSIESGTLVVGGEIFGSASLEKNGNGILVLTGDSTFSGSFATSGGIARFDSLTDALQTSSLGQGSVIQAGIISANGTLQFIGTAPSTTDRQFRIGSNGNGGGDATLLNDSIGATNTLVFTNPAFNPQNTNITSPGGRILTLGGANDGINEIQGTIQDHLQNASADGWKVFIVKNGAGTWKLSGANSYTGPTTVNGGILILAGGLAIDDTARLNINGGILQIDNDEAVNSLYYGGVLQAAGSYGSTASLAGTKDDTRYAGTGVLMVNTGAAPAGFANFIAGNFANGTVPADKQGANDDSDGDGLSNLVEYAIAGLDPTVGNGAVGTRTGNTISFAKRQPAAADLVYAIEESTDLGLSDPWESVTATEDGTTISYTLPAGPVKDFARLKVSMP